MAEKLKTALVGCGKVGHTHAAALSALPESRFVAVCDQSPDRARAFAGQYHVNAYTSVGEMVTAEGAQAVVVGTPHPVHAAVAVEAMRAGAHVLIEKPMASTLADCDAMLKTAVEAAVQIGVISQRRLYAPVQRVRAAIDSGKIGRPVLGMTTLLGWRDEAYYRSDPWRGRWDTEGGGVLVNQAPHQIDLLQWLMGPIAELMGYWANVNHPYIEVEDTAVAAIRFQNGGLGSIIFSNAQNPGLYGKVHIHGENGASVGVQTTGGSMFIAGMSEEHDPPVNDLWTVPGEEHLLAQWQADDRRTFETINFMTHYHRLQVQDFLQAVLEGRPPLITGEEGRKTVEIFTALYRSQRRGQAIRFPLIPEADDLNPGG